MNIKKPDRTTHHKLMELCTATSYSDISNINMLNDTKLNFLKDIKLSLMYLSPTVKREYISDVGARLDRRGGISIEVFTKDAFPFLSKEYDMSEYYAVYTQCFSPNLPKDYMDAMIKQIALGIATDFRDSIIRDQQINLEDYNVER